MFCVNVHFCNSTIVRWTYWQRVLSLNASRWKQSPGDHWQIPWLLIAIRRFEVRRCAEWFGCHLKGPSRRIASKTTGSIWTSKPYVFIYIYICIYICIVYSFIFLFIYFYFSSYLSIYRFIYLSFNLFILFIYLSIYYICLFLRIDLRMSFQLLNTCSKNIR